VFKGETTALAGWTIDLAPCGEPLDNAHGNPPNRSAGGPWVHLIGHSDGQLHYMGTAILLLALAQAAFPNGVLTVKEGVAFGICRTI